MDSLVKNSKYLIIPLLLVGLCLITNTGLAQTTGSVSGKILEDRTGEPLPGTNIFLKGTTYGTASGVDGSYTITNVPPGSYTLVATFIGFHTTENEVVVQANEMINVNFSLAEDVFRGEEIVVTGIASKTSKAIAEVAVSRVAVANYTEANSYQSLNQLVTGKIAGVTTLPSSGNVGGGFRFLVRSGGGLNGNEQPIIYLDGVRIETSEFVGRGAGGQGISLLSDLNPEEIENIEILKGPAAAASYGTSGSNGVVLITTKRGRLVAGSTRGVAIDYKVVVGQNRQSYTFDKWNVKPYEIANSIYRDGNIVQNSLSAAGGTNILRYYVSYDKRTEDGIVPQNHMNRNNIRANIDVVPNDKLTFRVTSSYINNQITRPQNDNNIYGYLGNTLLASGPWMWTDSLSIQHALNQIESNRFIGSFQAEYTPFRNFNTKISIGIDEDDIRQDTHFPLEYTYGVGQSDQGLRDVRNQRTSLYTYSFDARYQFSPMENLTLSAIAGAQLYDRTFRLVLLRKFNFLTSLITDVGAGSELAAASENFTHRREAGIFAETNLAYLDQYFLSLKFRRDYASAIGTDAPTINYPGASMAVRMDKYDWFPSVFGLFKTRVAYGETGVLPGLLDGIALLWQANTGGDGVGADIDQIGNIAIKPERVKEIELGFDAEFLNNYSVEFTYYKQYATDSIIDFDNAPSTGKTASALPFNIGKSHGSGFETLLQASPIRTRNFGLDLTLINNWQSNEVDSLGEAQPINSGVINTIQAGFPKHEFWGKVVESINYNDDGTYAGYETSAEKQRVGNPVPTYTGSFSLNLRMFKNLNLYVLTDWATGHSVLNYTRRFAVIFGGDLEERILGTQIGEYTDGSSRYESEAEILTPGTSEYNAAAEKFARLRTGSSTQTNWVEKADYFKLREISLSYSFKDLLPKLGLDRYLTNFQISLSGRNLWTTTKYSGADVEVNWSGADSQSRGNDFLTLQSPKVYNVAFRFSL